jgi:hypothetical protein
MWSDKMRHHLTSLHTSIWDVVEFGAQVPSVGDEGYDLDEVAQIRHFNSQATTILLASLSREEYRACLVQLFLTSFSENLAVRRIWLWRESEYRGDYVRRKMKWSKEFRI